MKGKVQTATLSWKMVTPSFPVDKPCCNNKWDYINFPVSFRWFGRADYFHYCYGCSFLFEVSTEEVWKDINRMNIYLKFIETSAVLFTFFLLVILFFFRILSGSIELKWLSNYLKSHRRRSSHKTYLLIAKQNSMCSMFTISVESLIIFIWITWKMKRSIVNEISIHR